MGELELVAPEVARVALKLLMLREELARLVVAEAEQHAPWTPRQLAIGGASTSIEGFTQRQWSP